MPIGSTSGARPKRLPSFQAWSSGRRFTGTMARISLPSGSSPWSRSQSPMAPDDRGEQHVVDRAAERLADRLHLLERDRLAPGDALPAARLALEQGRRVVGHHRHRGDVAEHLGPRCARRRSSRRCPSADRPGRRAARAMLASTSSAALAERPPSGFSTASDEPVGAVGVGARRRRGACAPAGRCRRR